MDKDADVAQHAPENGVNGMFEPYGSDALSAPVVGSGVIVNGDDAEHMDLQPPKKKKNKKRKPASKRGQGAPTGMEEFFADAPMTPDEFAEEQKLYDPDLPFLDRILTAIQRFERTRRLIPERRDAFYKWLQYGGVEVGPNMFVGAQDQEDMDKDQLATALSQAHISSDIQNGLGKADDEAAKFAVDFYGCMKAFLSRRVFTIWDIVKQDQVHIIVNTLERFMDYLMQHNVCPEYNVDILETRNFCRQAESEIWQCYEAQRWLPGDFNIACSTLFGGNYSRDYDGETWWGNEDETVQFVGLTKEKSTQIVGFGIAGAATEEMFQRYLGLTDNATGSGLEVIKTIRNHGFEIMEIHVPSESCKELYMTRSEDFHPVGRVLARYWQDPEAPPQDLTEEEAKQHQRNSMHAENLEFFIEDTVLQHLSVGQKVLATVRQLNCGIWFFDDFSRVLPSFETYLMNELMVGWKEPKPIKADTNEAEVAGEEGIDES